MPPAVNTLATGSRSCTVTFKISLLSKNNSVFFIQVLFSSSVSSCLKSKLPMDLPTGFPLPTFSMVLRISFSSTNFSSLNKVFSIPEILITTFLHCFESFLRIAAANNTVVPVPITSHSRAKSIFLMLYRFLFSIAAPIP